MLTSTICFRTGSGVVARQGNVVASLIVAPPTPEYYAKLDTVLTETTVECADGLGMVSLVRTSALVVPDRESAVEFMRHNRTRLRCISVVLEDQGFGAALTRTLATAMNLATSRRHVVVFDDRRAAVANTLRHVEPDVIARCARLPELVQLLSDLEASVLRLAV